MSQRDRGRRTFLRALLGGAAAAPFAGALGHRPALAAGPSGRAKRLIVFYFPDGVAGRSQDGEGSLWEARSEGGGIRLSEQLQPLAGIEDRCVFVNGMSMGRADEGSHPGGAKKLLTNKDGGFGMSVDQFLASTVGGGSPFRHLYLGAMATLNGASGDKFVSYPSAGVTAAPEDDPRRAFGRLFEGGVTVRPGDGPDPEAEAARRRTRSVLDASLADLNALRARLGTLEKSKLDLHLESLREVERRIAGVEMPPPAEAPSCDDPTLAYDVPEEQRFEPGMFPAILRAQTDLMVTAMACGLTQVGVLQGSHHTSELIMSRFMGAEMYDPGFDMRSHQASHYGARHDRSNRLFVDFLAQRRWWVSQFRYLLEELEARPEGDGTMLDHSLVLFCTEVSDGNTHSHQDMPFILAGGGGGCVSGGRVLETGGRRHGDLLAAICTARGEPVGGWGDGSGEVLPGLLS